MTTLRVLPLLLLCAVLTACSNPFRAVGSPTPAQDVSGRARVVESSPIATQRPQAANTPDFGAQTQSALVLQVLNATRTMEAKIDHISTETKSVSLTNAAYIVQTRAMQPTAQMQTLQAQSTANALILARMTQDADHATQTQEAPNNQATAAYLDAQSRNAPFLTVIWPVVAFVGSLAALILASMFAYLLLRPHPVVAERTIHPETVTRPAVPISPTGISTRPLPVDPDTFARFLTYAMQGKPLGANSMSDKAKIVTREDRAQIMPYLQNLGFLASQDGASVLSDDGIKWGGDWMREYHPAPDADLPESAAYTRTDYEIHRHESGIGGAGEGLTDHFDILKDGKE